MYARILATSLLLPLLHSPVLSQTEDVSRYVLLQNGQMIEGFVEQQENVITMVKPSGSRIVFSNSKIKLITYSKSEVYWQKCADLSATDVKGHTALFRWCLANELFNDAQNQIDLMQMMSIKASKLVDLNSRLILKRGEMARRIERERFAISALPAYDDNVLTIQQIGYDAPIDLAERARFNKTLDDTTESIPDCCVAMYKRKIEPLIIRTCLTAKCHDSDSKEMPLFVMGQSQRIPKRLSQRNMYNMLKYTDVNRPLDSRLLAAAGMPHAGQDKPMLPVDSPQFQMLRLWLIASSASPGSYHQIPAHFFKSDLAIVNQATNGNANQVPEKAPEKAPELRRAAKIPHGNNGIENSKEPAKQERDIRDPFDPAEFNKRYLKPSVK